jgi:hypothetical protein
VNIPKFREQWAKTVAKHRSLKFLKRDRELVKKVDQLWQKMDAETAAVYKAVAVLIPAPSQANKSKAKAFLFELVKLKLRVFMKVNELIRNWEKIYADRVQKISKITVPLTRLFTGNTPKQQSEKALLEWEAKLEKDLNKLGIEGALRENIVRNAEKERKAGIEARREVYIKLICGDLNLGVMRKLAAKVQKMSVEFSRFTNEMTAWIEEKMPDE